METKLTRREVLAKSTVLLLVPIAGATVGCSSSGKPLLIVRHQCVGRRLRVQWDLRDLDDHEQSRPQPVRADVGSHRAPRGRQENEE
jgi:hypothetical protein